MPHLEDFVVCDQFENVPFGSGESGQGFLECWCLTGRSSASKRSTTCSLCPRDPLQVIPLEEVASKQTVALDPPFVHVDRKREVPQHDVAENRRQKYADKHHEQRPIDPGDAKPHDQEKGWCRDRQRTSELGLLDSQTDRPRMDCIGLHCLDMVREPASCRTQSSFLEARNAPMMTIATPATATGAATSSLKTTPRIKATTGIR